MDPSTIQLKFIFNTFQVDITLKRYMAPDLLGRLMRRLPLKTYAFPLGGNLHVKVDLRGSGRVKIEDLGRGDIFYDTSQDSLAINFKPRKALRGELKIGEVIQGIERVEQIKRVESVEITLKK